MSAASHTTGHAVGRAVALGGGHGQARTLQALVEVADHVTAIATAADDGGSSGRLRDELGVLPPGDLRMAVSTLAGPGTLQRLVEHRFDAGELAGHSLGNLIITALAQIEGDFVAGLATLTRFLGIPHTVLPSTVSDVHLAADGPDGPIVGQAAIAATTGVRALRLVGEEPIATPAAVRAIEQADLIVLGPGSVCTSLVPNLLVPGIASALAHATAPIVLIANLDEQRGEGEGRGIADHLDLLAAAAPGVRPDHVIVHDGPPAVTSRPRLTVDAALERRTIDVVCADIATTAGGHDPAALATVLAALVRAQA